MKVLNRLLSLSLVLIIALQSLQITIFANNASINEILDGDYEYVIDEDDVLFFVTQEPVVDYSAFPEYETPFADLLQDNVSTDPITRITRLLDVDTSSAHQMVSVFGSEEAALEEALLYDSLRRTYYILDYDSVKDYLTSLVVNGYGAYEVAMSYIAAYTFRTDILDVIIDEYPEYQIEDEYKEALMYLYCVDPEFIDEYSAENQIDAQIMYLMVESLVEEMFPNASNSSTYSDDEEEDTSNYPYAPFYYQNSDSEYISPASGSLTYNLNLASVAGINGMDINLSLKYESGKAALVGEKQANGNGNSQGATINTWYDDYDWANKSPFIFGAGWRLNYDYLHMVDGKRYLVLSDGSEYEVSNYVTYKLDGYNKESITLVSDAGSYQGISKYKLTFSDGTVEYFDNDGNLLTKIDRYGNALTFTHSKITETEEVDGTMVTYTDRLVISNNHTSVTIDYNLANERILLPNGNVMRFTFVNGNGGYYLSSYTNCEGDVTQFSYNEVRLGNSDYSYNDGSMVRIYMYTNPIHYLLNSVVHPTSSVTQYEYRTISSLVSLIQTGSGAYIEAQKTSPAVSSRLDELNGVQKNRIIYTYKRFGNTNVPGGSYYSLYTADYGYKIIDYSPSGNGGVSKEVTTVDGDIKGWIERTYNTLLGKPTSIKTVEVDPAYGSLIGTGSWSDGNGGGVSYPIYDTTSYISNTISYTYDSKGYVLKSTENGLTKTYTYDATYHLPLTVTYSQDANTQIQEVYTLTADKKSVASKSVYVNGTLRGKYDYTYNNQGNVTLERAYKSSSQYINTIYGYNTEGRLISQTTANVTQSYTYDAMGRVLTETDGNNNTTSYVYDPMGRVVEVKHPDDSESDRSHITTVYTVSSTQNSVTETDELGNVKVYNYDGLGNIVSVYQNNVFVESYEYDEYSRVSKKTDALGNSTVYTYDYADRVINVSVYALNSNTPEYVETYSYETVVDGNLLKTVKTVVGDTNAPSIVTVTYTDEYGRTVKEGYLYNGSEILTYYTYDSLGNKLSDLSALDAQNGYTYTNLYSYNHLGLVTSTTNALNQTASTQYDWLGNATTSTDISNNVTEYTYDAFGRVLTQITPFDVSRATKLTYVYDNAGNVLRETTEEVTYGITILLSKTEYVYDNRNNLTTVKSFVSDTEYIITASYTYNKKGQMSSSTTGSYTTGYAYDAYGNVNCITYPDLSFETFVYYPDGKLASSTDRKGVTKTYTYNALGNPTLVTAGNSSIVYTYTATGALRSESNGSSIAYTYDSLGRVTVEDQSGAHISYTYDIIGNITNLWFASETGLTNTYYTYDRLNRMVSATEGNVQTVYSYDASGNRSETATYVGGVLTTQTTYTYNLANLATSLTNKNGAGTTLSSFAYTYSADGNILSEADHNGAFTNYTYDMLGRLISEVGTSGSRYYDYDNAGNRIQAIIDTITTISYTYNADGSLAYEIANNGSTSETTTYSYDLNGNLVSKSTPLSTTNYTYNVWGNMTSGAGASYDYNSQGLRRTKTTNGETDYFVLVGGNVWSDGDADYFRGIELISNGTQLYLYNIRGDVIQLTDLSGNVVKTYDYDAYGNELQRDLNDENPFRYCGEYYDAETGFIYLRARYYDPMVGRFTSVDPIKDGLNWYSYCYNNPVALIDNNGLWPSWSQILTAATIVITAAVVVTAVVATAGAAGAAIGIAAGIATGSTAIVSGVSTVATVAGYCLAGYIGATAVSDVGEVFTGVNVIRDYVLNGNQRAYDNSKTIAYAAAAGYVEVGSANSGLISNHSDETTSSEKSTSKVLQKHHYATNKSKTYTQQFEKIVKKYGLDLDGDWNKDVLPHQGRHPNAYHEFILEQFNIIDELANGDTAKFLELFESNVKKVIREHPEMLYKEYWSN